MIKPVIKATSGFIEAVCKTDGITTGKYSANDSPRILQILAQALIIYDVCNSTLQKSLYINKFNNLLRKN